MTEVTSSESSWGKGARELIVKLKFPPQEEMLSARLPFFGRYLLVDICFCILVNISCGGHLF